MKRMIISAILFIALFSLWKVQNPEEVLDNIDTVFSFEKNSVQAFKIVSPSGQEIQVYKKNGEWWLSPNIKASMTMVNRVRHQIHNLKLRALVKESEQDGSLYGLGSGATLVTVQLKGTQEIQFEVGDPNPTGVSFYIRPKTGVFEGAVVTVSKASVDYFKSDISLFRTQHFVEFGIDTVSRFTVQDNRGDKKETWECVRKSLESDEYLWHGIHNGEEIPLSSEFVRRILGRLLALKATEYFGESDPRVNTIKEGSVEVVVESTTGILAIEIGPPIEDGYSVFKLGDSSEFAVARNGLLEDLKMEETSIQRTKMLKEVLYDVAGWQRLTWSEASIPDLYIFDEQWLAADNKVDIETMSAIKEKIINFRRVPQQFNQQIEVENTMMIETKNGSVELLLGQLIELEDDRSVRVVSVKINSGKSEVVLVEEMWVGQLRDIWSSTSFQSTK